MLKMDAFVSQRRRNVCKPYEQWFSVCNCFMECVHTQDWRSARAFRRGYALLLISYNNAIHTTLITPTQQYIETFLIVRVLFFGIDRNIWCVRACVQWLSETRSVFLWLLLSVVLCFMDCAQYLFTEYIWLRSTKDSEFRRSILGD